MNKRIIALIVAIMVVAIAIGVVLVGKQLARIPDNSADTIGNTSGNLNNKGLFCEDDGYIYFANLEDSHCLYRMRTDCSNPEKVLDIPVSYINSAGDYIYFYFDDPGGSKFMGVAGRMSGVFRLKKGETDFVCLDKCTSGVLNLVGSTLYYEHYDNTNGMQLYHCSLDGKDKGLAVDEIINPACVINGNIYFCEQDSMKLKIYRPGDTSTRVFMDMAVYNPVLNGSDIYFMNMNDNYCLYRYSLSDASLTKVTNERVDTFNVYGNVIFYQRNQNPALIRVETDGSNQVVVATGNFENINCTSMYTFYSPFKEDALYVTYTFGGNGESSRFVP
ncbi:MAG: DUF5050 domain-containing protein [Lachnospiraceae bacterium]|nr:DUF5050 domain-containing protein [Lachnospiraceae bacterium]